MQTNTTGANLLVDALKVNGLDTAFGVPGESTSVVVAAIILS